MIMSSVATELQPQDIPYQMTIYLNDITLVAQRELRHYLRDPHVLIYSVLLPALLYPIVVVLMIEGSLWQESLAEKRGVKIGVVGKLSASTSSFLEVLKKAPNVTIKDLPDAIDVLKSGELDAVIQSGENNETNLLLPPRVSSDLFSPRSKLEKFVDDFQKNSFKELLAKRGLTPEQLTAFLLKQTNVSKVATSLTTIIPYICCLALMIMSLGAIYPAISAFTEEREKRTLESTLTLPIDRLSLVLGKHAANSLVTFLSAMLNLICIMAVVGLLGSLPQADALQLGKSLWFTPVQFVMLMLAFVITATEVSALYLLLSQFTRTFREAQNLLTLPSLLLSLTSMMAMSPVVVLNLPISLIPILNTYIYCKAIYSNHVPWSLCFLSLGVNIIITVVLLTLLSRIVDQEQFSLSPSSFRKFLRSSKAK